MEYLTSGQIAKINRVGEKALRIYEKKGLLVPEATDPDTGWRQYSAQQSFKLDFILQLQQIGLSLDEIAEINEQKDIAQLRDVLSQHRQNLSGQIRQLEIALTVADDFVKGCNDYLSHPPYNKIILEQLPPRPILKFPVPAAGETDTRVKPNLIGQWDAIVRYARQQIIDEGYPPVLFRDLGSLLSLEGASEDDTEHPFVTDVFVYLDEQSAQDYPETVTLERGTCLTLRGDTAYTEDGLSLNEEQIRRMAEYAERIGMVPIAEPFGETLCSWPRLLDESYHQEYRLCLPVAYAECA